MKIDYTKYNMSFFERIKYQVIGILIFSGILWLFFRNIYILILSIPASFLYIKLKKNKLIKRRKDMVLKEFIEMLTFLSDALRMSYSLEKSFAYAKEEIINLYGNKSYLAMELGFILTKYELNIPIENSFRDFAIRTGIDELMFFSKIIEIGKKQGGNMIDMIKNCSNILTEIVLAKRDIEVFLAGKVSEKKFMDKVPLFIIIYVFLTSKEMIMPLYTGVGRLIMIFAISLYVFAYYLGEKIVDIKV